MFNSPTLPASIGFLQFETILLESEEFEQSRVLSAPLNSEANQWQTYLNALARLGFEQWLDKRIPEHSIARSQSIHSIENVCRLKIGKFKLYLIVREHILDEVAEIPREAIDQPELASHFYVLLEVSEEQEQVIIRGFLRYDELMSDCSRANIQHIQDGYYQFPLFAFDSELNHLLFYCHFLEPNSISLPVTSTEHSVIPAMTTESTSSKFFQGAKTNLSQWMQGISDQGWQTIDTLLNSETHLALSPRNQRKGARRGKLIDLRLQLQGQNTVLLLNIIEETEDKLGVLVQLHPTGEGQFLPPDLRLLLLSEAGETLQEVCSRTQDNYIQLKAFKGKAGTPFSVEISLGNSRVRENFEL